MVVCASSSTTFLPTHVCGTMSSLKNGDQQIGGARVHLCVSTTTTPPQKKMLAMSVLVEN